METLIKHHGDDSPVVRTKRVSVTELQQAVRQAQDATVWINIELAAGMIGRPVSTVRRHCDKHRDRVGAYKDRGVWMIHWPTFESAYPNIHLLEKAA